MVKACIPTVPDCQGQSMKLNESVFLLNGTVAAGKKNNFLLAPRSKAIRVDRIIGKGPTLLIPWGTPNNCVCGVIRPPLGPLGHSQHACGAYIHNRIFSRGFPLQNQRST